MLPSRFWLALAILGLLYGCARLERAGEVEPGSFPAGSAAEEERYLSRLDEIDTLLKQVFSDHLPPLKDWHPRSVVPRPEGEPQEVVRALEVSSLCYFPRFFPRLIGTLQRAGVEMVQPDIFSSGEENFCSLRISPSPDLVYVYELSQVVKGKAALIIDDLGYTLEDKEIFLDLDYPLTAAILPHLPHSSDWDRLASSGGFEVLLHCPLEARDVEIDPGPGSIMVIAPGRELNEILDGDLESVPHAVGVNNHMGSGFTIQTGAMRSLLQALRDRGLFFVDSLTIDHTVTRAAAEDLGVRFAVRDVFLDHQNAPELIISQIELWKEKALRKGRAVGIGHYRKTTLEILKRELPGLAEDGIQIVPVSDLVR